MVNTNVHSAEGMMQIPSPGDNTQIPYGSVMISSGDGSGGAISWVQDISLNSINLPSGPVGSALLITHTGSTSTSTSANLVIENGTATATATQTFTQLQNGTILFKTYDIIDGEPDVSWSSTGITVTAGSVKWTAIGVVNR